MDADTYSVAEVARRLGVSDQAVYDEVRRGRMPALRIGRRIVFPRQRFESWFAGEDAPQRLQSAAARQH